VSAGRGRVFLVGAGPGHPGLITLRGAEVLRGADVVLYDSLAPAELLELAPSGAERIDVGRRGHDAPTRSQEEIVALLVSRARAGHTVVRLKGGDPYVFGRGGEEASACRAAGLPFEVVPGVSSALAAPAYAGIPLTDRRHAASFAVVTGHKDPTRAARDTRWADLAQAVDTLVVLMGVRNLPALVERMLAGGLDPDTPAAVVEDGTRPTQRTLEAPLVRLPEVAARAGVRAPAAVVVGEVVRLRPELAFFEERPLFGRRVLVTRAAEQALELVSALRAEGADTRTLPLVAFERPGPEEWEPLVEAFRHLDAYDAVVFASANAVRFACLAACEAGVELGAGATRLACVGPRTARELLDRGLPVHCAASGAEGGGAEALLRALALAMDPGGRRVLLPRSHVGREALAQGLRQAGARVDALTAYRTVRPPVDGAGLRRQLVEGELPILTFTSPSTVAHFVDLLDEEARAAAGRCLVGALGTTTARALESAGLPAQVVPERPDVAGLADALSRFVAGPSERGGAT